MNWREAALCRLLPLVESDRLFFSNDAGALAEAKAMCVRCPVSAQCRTEVDRLEVGVLGDSAHSVGVWAGERPAERRHRREESVLAY